MLLFFFSYRIRFRFNSLEEQDILVFDLSFFICRLFYRFEIDLIVQLLYY